MSIKTIPVQRLWELHRFNNSPPVIPSPSPLPPQQNKSTIENTIFSFKSIIQIYMYSNDWEMIDHGPSFIEADLIFVKETLINELPGSDDSILQKKAGRISKILKYNLGKGQWQVFCIKGSCVRKMVCSRNYYCIFKKKDGLNVYIWVNRFRDQLQVQPYFQS